MTNIKSLPGFGDAQPDDQPDFTAEVEHVAQALIKGAAINAAGKDHTFNSVRNHLYAECDALADELDVLIQRVCMEGMTPEIGTDIEDVFLRAAADYAEGWISEWAEKQKREKAIDHAVGF